MMHLHGSLNGAPKLLTFVFTSFYRPFEIDTLGKLVPHATQGACDVLHYRVPNQRRVSRLKIWAHCCHTRTLCRHTLYSLHLILNIFRQSRLLSFVYQSVVTKYGFESSADLRSACYNNLRGTASGSDDLAAKIKNIGNLWALPVLDNAITMLSYDQ